MTYPIILIISLKTFFQEYTCMSHVTETCSCSAHSPSYGWDS